MTSQGCSPSPFIFGGLNSPELVPVGARILTLGNGSAIKQLTQPVRTKSVVELQLDCARLGMKIVRNDAAEALQDLSERLGRIKEKLAAESYLFGCQKIAAEAL